MTSDTCATSATALVASVSRVMGSLTVQCMAAPPGEGVAVELSRASSMASRSGHGDAGEDDDARVWSLVLLRRVMRTFRYVFPVPDASPSARLTFPFPFRPVLDVHGAYVQQLCSHDE